MHRRSSLVLGVSLTLCVACARPHKESAALDPAQSASAVRKPLETLPADTKIVLERGRCGGSCPAYVLTITADGRVRFEGGGYAYGPPPGEPNMVDAGDATMPKEKLLALVNRIREAGFFELDDKYPAAATDGGHTIVSVTLAGRTKIVGDRVGMVRGAAPPPAALEEVELEIDRVAETRQFLNAAAK